MNALFTPPDVERCEITLRNRPLLPLKIVVILTAAVSFFAGGVFTYGVTPAPALRCSFNTYAEK